MALTPQYLSVYSGTSKTFSIVLTQDDGVTPIALGSAVSIQFLAKRALTDSDSAAAITKGVGTGVTVTNAPTGQVTVALLPADTAGQEGTTVLVWAIKVDFSGTSEAIGCVGTLTLLPSAVAGV